ncbi:MAG TPA: hypothetical protein VF988_09850, partial [Verrucomicrobiae bacterium]
MAVAPPFNLLQRELENDGEGASGKKTEKGRHHRYDRFVASKCELASDEKCNCDCCQEQAFQQCLWYAQAYQQRQYDKAKAEPEVDATAGFHKPLAMQQGGKRLRLNFRSRHIAKRSRVSILKNF